MNRVLNLFLNASIACTLLLASPLMRAAESQKTLLFFGDSLTAGYGLADPDDESYPAQVQKHIDAEHLPWHVVNAGLSG